MRLIHNIDIQVALCRGAVAVAVFAIEDLSSEETTWNCVRTLGFYRFVCASRQVIAGGTGRPDFELFPRFFFNTPNAIGDVVDGRLVVDT